MNEYIAIVSGAAGDELIAAIGTNVVPIRSNVLTVRHFGHEERKVFILDHKRLSADECDKLIEFLRVKFALHVDSMELPMPRGYIERNLAQLGFSLPAADCAVRIFDRPAVRDS